MADPKKLADYIASEIVAEFKLGESNEQLDRYASAISKAIDKYLTTDVKVKVGIQVDSTFSEPDEIDPLVTVITKVKGQTTTAGDLF